MEKLSLGGRFIGLSNSTARGSGDRQEHVKALSRDIGHAQLQCQEADNTGSGKLGSLE